MDLNVVSRGGQESLLKRAVLLQNKPRADGLQKSLQEAGQISLLIPGNR